MSEDPNKDYNAIRMAHYFEDARISSKGAIDFASIGLRSLFLVNGGALLALLTFIGNAGIPENASESYSFAFFAFGAGVIFALISVFFSYFSQGVAGLVSAYDADWIYFSQIEGKKVAEELKADGNRERKVNQRLRYIAVGCALASGALFTIGIFFAFDGVVTSS